MLRMIHHTLARRATRWIAVPALGLTAGAAMLSLGLGGGSLATVLAASHTNHGRGCGAGHPIACGQASTAATIKSLHITAAPRMKLPATMPAITRQPASPMTATERLRQAQFQRTLKALFPNVTTTP
jgi:hypothetical protein